MAQELDAWLEGISGEEVGREFKLIKEETIVGRGKESQIQILDPGASRQHAAIRFSSGGCVIEDLGSTRGTYVNGEVIQSTELKDGDTITLGDTSFRFHYEPDIESAPTVMADEDAIATMMAPPEMMVAEQGESRCAQCGAALRAEEKFCGDCGTPRLGDMKPPVEADVPPAPEPTRQASDMPEEPPPAVTPSGPPPTHPSPAITSPTSGGIPWKWIVIVGGGFVVLAIAIAATALAFGFFAREHRCHSRSYRSPIHTDHRYDGIDCSYGDLHPAHPTDAYPDD